MEETLIPIPESDKKSIEITKLTESDANNWNLCGGVVLLGCWFGFCLLPLVEISKPVKKP
jgi:hypothetical protein